MAASIISATLSPISVAASVPDFELSDVTTSGALLATRLTALGAYLTAANSVGIQEFVQSSQMDHLELLQTHDDPLVYSQASLLIERYLVSPDDDLPILEAAAADMAATTADHDHDQLPDANVDAPRTS